MFRGFAICVCLIGLCACDDDLPKPTLIAHMRVLGARIEVMGDEARSTPRPGERARISWSVAYPDYDTTDRELASLFVVCSMPERYTGTPVCQELIDASKGLRGSSELPAVSASAGCDAQPDSTRTVLGVQLVCVTNTPRFELEVAPSVRRDRLVQGIVCRNGVPDFDPASPIGVSCARNAGVRSRDFESIAVYGTIPVAESERQENQNPRAERVRLQLAPDQDGARRETWQEAPPDELPALIEDCAAANSDRVPTSDGEPQVIRIGYPEGPETVDKDLVFSTYATFGELSRRFSVLEAVPSGAEQPDLTWALSQKEQDEVRRKPKLVRFFFSVLDGRGGFAVTTRELCIERN